MVRREWRWTQVKARLLYRINKEKSNKKTAFDKTQFFNVKFSIKITKPNGSVRDLHSKPLNKTGQNIFFLGTNKGDYVIHVEFKGNNNYNPSSLTKTVSVTAGSGGNSIYDYYDHHNYGDNVRMDDYIYDNYWYEDIYDDPSTFDGEGYWWKNMMWGFA